MTSFSGRKTKLFFGLMLVATPPLYASQQNTFVYYNQEKNSFTAMCDGGDLPVGCGATCPPAQHLQKVDLYRPKAGQPGAGLYGCKANCQTETAEIPAVNVTAFCVHQECSDQGVCFVDPNGHYIQGPR